MWELCSVGSLYKSCVSLIILWNFSINLFVPMHLLFKNIIWVGLAICLTLQGVLLLQKNVSTSTIPDSTQEYIMVNPSSFTDKYEKEPLVECCNFGNEEDKSESEKKSSSESDPYGGIKYSLAIQSSSVQFPTEAFHRSASPISAIFRPPQA